MSEKLSHNPRHTTDSIIQSFRAAHGTKYDYTKVIYGGYHNKVEIICPRHGSFHQSVANHIKGSGCRKCASEYKSSLFRKNTEDFIKAAIEIHGEKYNYDQVTYINRSTYVDIWCNIHQSIFRQSPGNHLNGKGCPRCARDRTINAKQKTTEEFIYQANLKHNFKYDYSEAIYTKALEKITIICPHHGRFSQSASGHLVGKGCPRCTHQVSMDEENWLDSLNITHLKRNESLCDLNYRKVDGYDSVTNTVYQYHGDYWHGNPEIYDGSYVNPTNGKTMKELYDRTTALDRQILEMGYNLVVMWESQWREKMMGNNDERY